MCVIAPHPTVLLVVGFGRDVHHTTLAFGIWRLGNLVCHLMQSCDGGYMSIGHVQSTRRLELDAFDLVSWLYLMKHRLIGHDPHTEMALAISERRSSNPPFAVKI